MSHPSNHQHHQAAMEQQQQHPHPPPTMHRSATNVGHHQLLVLDPASIQLAPPPPYTTLPTRNQRRLMIEPNSTSGSVGSLAHPVSMIGASSSQSVPSPNQACPILPSYHHLYSSSSPSSLRRRRHRIRQRRRETQFEENRKYLIGISIIFVVGIILTFLGVLTLSLFTLSFGFTFILFALLLYKLLPSSKYAVSSSPGSPSAHAHPWAITDFSFGVPPMPPPSYQEAINSTQLVQLQPTSYINRVTSQSAPATTGGHTQSGTPGSTTVTLTGEPPVHHHHHQHQQATTTTKSAHITSDRHHASVNVISASHNNALRTSMDDSSTNNRLHFVTIIEATI